MTTEKNTISGEVRTRLDYAELGRRMIKACGVAACRHGYGTSDPQEVGKQALAYGDINPDGTLN